MFPCLEQLDSIVSDCNCHVIGFYSWLEVIFSSQFIIIVQLNIQHTLNISRSKVKMEQEVKEESKTLDKTAKVKYDILKIKVKNYILKFKMKDQIFYNKN